LEAAYREDYWWYIVESCYFVEETIEFGILFETFNAWNETYHSRQYGFRSSIFYDNYFQKVHQVSIHDGGCCKSFSFFFTGNFYSVCIYLYFFT